MRIYAVSAHSTGKTTICKYISEKYKIPLITEVARSVASEHEWSIDSLRTDLQKVNQYQKEIFYRQLQEEKKYENQNFVSDRGFDFLSYCVQHSCITQEILKTEEWKNYIESLKKDDVLILFFRPHKSLLKNDGVRELVNWEGVVAIDAMTKMLLQMFGLKYFQIDCVSMQERTNLVDNIIDLFLAKEEKKKENSSFKMTKEEYFQEEEKMEKELKELKESGDIKFEGNKEENENWLIDIVRDASEKVNARPPERRSVYWEERRRRLEEILKEIDLQEEQNTQSGNNKNVPETSSEQKYTGEF